MRSLADAAFDKLVRDFPALQSRRGEGIDFVNFDCELVESCCGSSYVIPFVSETECLVTMRENGRWVLPGGTLEPGEGWLQAAHREVMEETGAVLSNIKPIGMYHWVSQEAQPRLPHFPTPFMYGLFRAQMLTRSAHRRIPTVEVRSLKCRPSSTARQQINFPLTIRILRHSTNWRSFAEDIGHRSKHDMCRGCFPSSHLAHPITRPCPASALKRLRATASRFGHGENVT